MSETLGRSVGGLKTQNRLLRARMKKLESDVAVLYWTLTAVFGTVAITLLWRAYGR